MKISSKGLNIIKKYEGCRLKAYKCPAGVWTIGYGHTGPDVKEGMEITQSKAEALLIIDVNKFEKKVDKYLSKYNFNQNQYDALVSFAYNVGSIDQLTKNGTRSIYEIEKKIPEYNKGGGKVLPGLVKRRAEEKALFHIKTTEKIQEKIQPKQITYKVVKGDTLTKIAKKFNTTVKKIAEDNKIKDVNKIKVGQVLIIK